METWAQSVLAGHAWPTDALGLECPLSGANATFAILTLGKGLPVPLRRNVKFAWQSYEYPASLPGLGPAGIHIAPAGRVTGFLRAISRKAPSNPFGDEAPDSLYEALDSVPANAELFNVSRIFSRPERPWKLNLALPAAKLGSFLETCGWTGDRRVLRSLMRDYFADSGAVRIDAGFSPGILPRIGFEIFAGTDTYSDRDRIGFLRKLRQAGLCSDGKSAAIGSWRALASARTLDSPAGLPIIRNWYLKLVLEGDGSLTAKAYLYCRPFLFP